jgi:hypothetical protein
LLIGMALTFAAFAATASIVRANQYGRTASLFSRALPGKQTCRNRCSRDVRFEEVWWCPASPVVVARTTIAGRRPVKQKGLANVKSEEAQPFCFPFN